MAALTGERCFKRIDVRGDDECWLYMGHRQKKGYGNTHGRLVHRLAWRAVNGEIPEGMCVLHRCDNPPCCNPKHLFLGTLGDNNRDRDRKGRSTGGSLRGAENPHAKLTSEMVSAIRAANGSVCAIARAFGLKHQLVSKVRNRSRWAWLP